MNTQINPAYCPICQTPEGGHPPKPPRDDSTIWVVVALLVVVAVFVFS